VLTVDLIGSRPSETADNLATFMKTNNYTFPALLGPSKDMIKNYGLTATPTNYLIGKDGIIKERRLSAWPTDAAFEESLSNALK
jgi:hypothetical protein